MTNAAGLRVLSIALGVFLIFMGLDKIGWLMDSSLLTGRLQQWRASAPPMSAWYLDSIAIPGAPFFARLVLLAELSAGAALLAGVRVRLAAALSLLMVLTGQEPVAALREALPRWSEEQPRSKSGNDVDDKFTKWRDEVRKRGY